MEITLISKKQYDKLLAIQKENEILTFQNKGYQYIDKRKFSENDKKAFIDVTNILKDHITGFSEFNNFKIRGPNNDITLRFQYNYGAENDSHSFIGVGYILLEELLNGFKEN
jgi:hypothetical protein